MHPRQQKCSLCIIRYFGDPVAAIQSFKNVGDSFGGIPLRMYSGLFIYLSINHKTCIFTEYCLMSVGFN